MNSNLQVSTKQKVLLISMVMTSFEDDLIEVEKIIIRQEFTHMEDEILRSQENISAVGIQFTLNLN